MFKASINLNLSLFALLIGFPATAGDFQPSDAYLSLKGTWSGTLSYRDYQADKWYALPVQKTVSVLPGDHSLLETAAYDDGPKTGMVYIHSLSAFEPDGQTLKTFSTRKGRPASSDSETVSFGAANPTPFDFVLIFEHLGEDADRPARIRVTLTYKGDGYTTLKQVDFTDDAKDEWLTRNKSTLRRIKP